MQYTLPRNLYDELVKKIRKESAVKFVSVIEWCDIIQKET